MRSKELLAEARFRSKELITGARSGIQASDHESEEFGTNANADKQGYDWEN